MSAPVRITLLLALACALPLAAVAQDQLPTGIPKPRDGEGWTKDDVLDQEHLPNFERIDATVVRFAVSAGGRFVVTLDNGTRWTQMENRAAARVAVGDQIILRKMTLGSYSLTTKDGVTTRVYRNR